MGKRLKRSRPIWADHRLHLDAIARAALDAVNPYDAVHQHLQLHDNLLVAGQEEIKLEEDSRIFVVGAGKAGVAMARAAEHILGERIEGGLVSVPNLPVKGISSIRLCQGGHPIPTEGSIQAGNEIRKLLKGVRENDLVLVLISGGGSALLELPLEGLELSDVQKMNELLIKSGAPIQDVNTVRRYLSQIKGGGLARLASPAQTVALILSDVVGDALEAIASGPTVPFATTRGDVRKVLERYQIRSRLPENVRHILEGSVKERQEVPDMNTDRVINLIVGSNTIAAEAAVTHARELGFRGILLTTMLQGEAREVGRRIAGLAKSVRLPENASPAGIVLGGETTVTVKGSGMGGRNQELALAAAMHLEGVLGVVVMTLATDGVDGPTPAAGAIVHGGTMDKAHAQGLDAGSFLNRNDSHTFFDKISDTVTLGPTGTNVNDLVFCLVYDA